MQICDIIEVFNTISTLIEKYCNVSDENLIVPDKLLLTLIFFQIPGDNGPSILPGNKPG